MQRILALLALALPTFAATPALATDLPAGIARQVPPGFHVLAATAANPGGSATAFYIVALARTGDGNSDERNLSDNAPARPLILFGRQPGGTYRQLARNDTVILRANQGGQCDPFLDGGARVAVKGAYFTVQNGVACGQHWTDYITFRFDGALGRYVFDNERSESWSLNSSTAPDAEAVVRDGPPRVRRANPAHPVTFEAWRPAR